MQTYSNLNKRIMRRVYVLYVYHRLVNPIAFKLYAAAIFALALSTTVSISHVIANMPSLTDFGAWFQFNIAAFSHTDLTVKMLLVVLAVLALWLGRDAIRAAALGSGEEHSLRSFR